MRCIRHDLLDADVVHGHSLIVAEFNRDGLLDIYCGETAKWTESRAQPGNPEAHMWLGINSGGRNIPPNPHCARLRRARNASGRP